MSVFLFVLLYWPIRSYGLKAEKHTLPGIAACIPRYAHIKFDGVYHYSSKTNWWFHCAVTVPMLINWLLFVFVSIRMTWNFVLRISVLLGLCLALAHGQNEQPQSTTSSTGSGTEVPKTQPQIGGDGESRCLSLPMSGLPIVNHSSPWMCLLVRLGETFRECNGTSIVPQLCRSVKLCIYFVYHLPSILSSCIGSLSS